MGQTAQRARLMPWNFAEIMGDQCYSARSWRRGEVTLERGIKRYPRSQQICVSLVGIAIKGVLLHHFSLPSFIIVYAATEIRPSREIAGEALGM